MKKVKLIKDHNGKKKGTVGELPKGRADYLIRGEIAVEVEDSKVKKQNVKKEATKPCKTC